MPESIILCNSFVQAEWLFPDPSASDKNKNLHTIFSQAIAQKVKVWLESLKKRDMVSMLMNIYKQRGSQPCKSSEAESTLEIHPVNN